MNQKALLIGLLLLVATVVVAMSFRGSEVGLLPPSDDPPAATDAAAARPSTEHLSPTDATAAAPIGETQRAIAATWAGEQRPFTAGAPWVLLRVIDKASQQPVPGALVHWCDQAAWQVAREDRELTNEDRTLLWHSVEALAERVGWHTVTDQQGLARVTLNEWTNVTAAADGRSGTLRLQAETLRPAAGYVLELEPERQILVQVMDDRGAPAPGVLIGLGRENDDRDVELWTWGPVARTRATDGIAVISHLQSTDRLDARVLASGRPKAESRPWRVFVLLPGHEHEGIPVSIDQPPADPIVLRLPPCGRVRAKAEFAGAPLPGLSTVRLHAKARRRPPHDDASTERRVEADGWARFPLVPLGCSFVVSAGGTGNVSTTFTGPTMPDQEVAVVIQPANDLMLLRGRLVDAAREPMRDQDVAFRARGPQVRASDTVRTDNEGRFLVSLGRPRKDNRIDEISFDVRPKGEAPRRAEAAARELRSGVEDLGDLVIGDGSFVCAGQFRSGDGPPTKSVGFWVEREEPATDRRSARWRRVQGVVTHQDESGAFSVRGTAPPARYRLAFDTHRLLLREPVEFNVGTTDLVIPIDAGNPLAATVLVPEGAPESLLRALLVPARAKSATVAGALDSGASRYLAHPWVDAASGKRRNLHWPSLEAGVYALELRLWCSEEPLVRIADIRVPLAEAGDPRLEDIDLRPFLRLLHIHLFDELGKPLESPEGAIFLSGQAANTEWKGYEIDGTVSPLLVRQGPVDLLVAVSGHHPQQVHNDGEQAFVRLDPWPKVEITIEGLPELPKQISLVARMRATDSVETKYRSQWQNQETIELYSAPNDGTTVENSRAALPIGDGPHTLHLTLYGDRHTVQLDGFEPSRFLAGTRAAVVRVPAAEWERALKVLQQPSK